MENPMGDCGIPMGFLGALMASLFGGGGSPKFLLGTFKSLHGTSRFLHETFESLHGIFQGPHGIFPAIDRLECYVLEFRVG